MHCLYLWSVSYIIETLHYPGSVVTVPDTHDLNLNIKCTYLTVPYIPNSNLNIKCIYVTTTTTVVFLRSLLTNH